MNKTAKKKDPETTRGRGRPATGKTKGKLSVSVNTSLIKEAMKMATQKGESLSQFVSRALQNQILES